MAKESDRIFSIPRELIDVGQDVADQLEERLTAMEQLFFSSLDFLAQPHLVTGIYHDSIAGLAKFVRELEEDRIEVVVHPKSTIDSTTVYDLGANYAQVQIPTDYLEVAEEHPTDVLFHSVGVASRLKDIAEGKGVFTDESDARASIYQADFLLWWEKASQSFGIVPDSRELHEAVLGLYPKGHRSPTAIPFVHFVGPLNIPEKYSGAFIPYEPNLN